MFVWVVVLCFGGFRFTNLFITAQHPAGESGGGGGGGGGGELEKRVKALEQRSITQGIAHRARGQ